MGKFAFKVAYTKDDSKIQPALDAGTIDTGDLIIKDNDDGSFVMRFIDQESGILKETCIDDTQISEKVIPAVLEETDQTYLKKDDKISGDQIDITALIDILNGNTALEVPEVVSSVSSASELAAAINDTSVTTITLAGDILDLAESFDIINRDLTIDLAGHTIANTADLWSDHCVSVFQVGNGTLTITGNGSILPKENDCYALTVRENGTLIIENGTFDGNITTVYLYGDNSALYIKDGTFKIQQLNTNGVESSYGLMINVQNSFRDTAYVEITGGTFEHYNPAAPEEGSMVYLPSGYTTTYDESTDSYTVVKEG